MPAFGNFDSQSPTERHSAARHPHSSHCDSNHGAKSHPYPYAIDPLA